MFLYVLGMGNAKKPRPTSATSLRSIRRYGIALRDGLHHELENDDPNPSEQKLPASTLRAAPALDHVKQLLDVSL
jgi:hypothetical protein